MIVRILNEGQYVIEQEALLGLNELDAAVEAAVDADDQDALSKALSDLFDHVRAAGQLVPDDILADSDLILPDIDSTLDEVRALIEEDPAVEGFIPEQ